MKNIYYFFLFVLLAVFVAGCGDSGSVKIPFITKEEEKQPEEKPKKPSEIIQDRINVLAEEQRALKNEIEAIKAEEMASRKAERNSLSSGELYSRSDSKKIMTSDMTARNKEHSERRQRIVELKRKIDKNNIKYRALKSQLDKALKKEAGESPK